MASTDATPFPMKGVAYRVTFPIFDADGDLVTGAASDTPIELISKDGGTAGAVTAGITEIATASGMYFLDLTSTEMDANTVVITVATATAGTKTTPIVLYPDAAIVQGAVDATVSPTTIEFETSDITEATASHFDDRIIVFLSGALAGQITSITTYSLVGGRGHFLVPALTEAPSSGDRFRIY